MWYRICRCHMNCVEIIQKAFVIYATFNGCGKYPYKRFHYSLMLETFDSQSIELRDTKITFKFALSIPLQYNWLISQLDDFGVFRQYIRQTELFTAANWEQICLNYATNIWNEKYINNLPQFDIFNNSLTKLCINVIQMSYSIAIYFFYFSFISYGFMLYFTSYFFSFIFLLIYSSLYLFICLSFKPILQLKAKFFDCQMGGNPVLSSSRIQGTF